MCSKFIRPIICLLALAAFELGQASPVAETKARFISKRSPNEKTTTSPPTAAKDEEFKLEEMQKKLDLLKTMKARMIVDALMAADTWKPHLTNATDGPKGRFLMQGDDPTKWLCRGKPLKNLDQVKRVLAECSNEAGVCKNLCAFKKSDVLDENLEFSEKYTIIMFNNLVERAEDVLSLTAELKECSKVIKKDDKDPRCSGNEEFTACVKRQIEHVCKLPGGTIKFG